ncbi:MAG: NADH-quinone oxidoreductase subunit I [Deltaproteobacteria bacterium]|nr:NADH-quinone oxidoreductase subunit I [Deltaproteobacteria bacterium]
MGKLVERPEPDVIIQSYLPEVWNGMKRTSRHFFANLLMKKGIATIQYPDEKVTYPPRFRGNHRLMHREDGSVRCVACYLCSTACPADCIHIVAGETDDTDVEKAPTVFEIDHLRCIFCGFCEEACPCDAIRLDSGEHRVPAFCRKDEMSGKEDLLSRGAPSVSKQGGEFK